MTLETLVDKTCLWKQMEENIESTTFQIVKLMVKAGHTHPLEPCLYCSGMDDACKFYAYNGKKKNYTRQ